MRKQITFLIMLFFIFPFFARSWNGISDDNSTILLSPYHSNESEYSLIDQDSEYNLSIMNLQVDALGLLFFGPQVALDFQFANIIAIGPFIRWNYAGLIYQGVVTDWFSDETTTSLASYSVGAQAKAVIPVGSGQHRPYIGVGVEKSFGSDSYDPGGTLGRRIYEYETNVFHLDLGYRLLTSSAFNLSAGVAIGIAKDTKSIGYYENDEGDITHYDLETRILPMVQLVLGWQLGK